MFEPEADRLTALYDFAVLDTLPEERFDRLTTLAAALFDAPIALVSLIDKDRQWFKSRFGLDASETPRAWAFCDHAIKAGPDTTFVVEDATADPRFADNPLVVGELNIRFYAGATLTTMDGHNLGTLCVIDKTPRPSPSETDLNRLAVLARMVVDELELAKATRAVEEQTRLLGLAEAMSGVGHWRYQVADGRITWSEEVYRIHGVTPGLFDPNLDRALAFYHPEDVARVTDLLGRAVSHGEDFTFQLRLIRPSGEVRHVSCKASCELDGTGGAATVTGVFQDITEQVTTLAAMAAREARYRLLADNASDMIAQFKPGGWITFITPSCMSILGHTPEEMVGRRALDMTHPDDVETVRAYYKALRKTTGSMPEPIQFRARHRDGRWIWLEGHPTMYFDPVTGEAVEMQDAVRDITKRKALELELECARAGAETAAAAKTDFLAKMSHELRTPLNGVLGFTDLLERTRLEPDQRLCVDRIVSAGRSLLGVINDILDFSKIEAGRLSIEQRPYDLRRIIGEVVELVGAANPHAHVTLSRSISPEVAKAYLGDEHRVRQIITNVLGNAVKFTQVGAVSIIADVEEDRLRVTVTDTGPGIAADKLASVFDGFTQADNSIARQYGGTGLGLPISRSLARLMGGDLTLESQVGVGADVTLWLPNTACAPVAQATAEPASPAAATPKAARIMMVDDVEMNRELVKLSLEPAGYRIEGFASAKAAIAVLEGADRFDVILMDIQMPEMDGLTATRLIRRMPAPVGDIPIIALTANALADQAAACLEAGMDAHLAKPIDLKALQTTIERIWRERNEPKRADQRPAPAPADPLAALRERYRVYLTNAPGEFAALMAHGSEAERAKAVGALAHSIAGTAGSFGFTAVSDAAFTLEATAKSGEAGAALAQAVNVFVGALIQPLAA